MIWSSEQYLEIPEYIEKLTRASLTRIHHTVEKWSFVLDFLSLHWNNIARANNVDTKPLTE